MMDMPTASEKEENRKGKSCITDTAVYYNNQFVEEFTNR